MGIRLDWEIEADKRTIKGSGEDPNARRNRRKGYLRLLLIIGAVFAILAVGAYLIIDRINDVNNEIEQILRDTVESEVTALRIGDWNAFAQIQRSASSTWLQEQRILFDDYQEDLRQDESLQLTGAILDIEIDDPRARVTVQELQGGIPYTRLWFYYRFEDDISDPPDGVADEWQWYHVPPDTAFWGESESIEGEQLTIEYRTVDADLAEAMSDSFSRWVDEACVALSCDNLPHITVEITSEDVEGAMKWADDDPWRMLVMSPLRNRARSDRPFDPAMEVEAAALLAERLVGYVNGSLNLVVGTDAYYLQWEAVVPWLVGRMTQVNTGAYLIESLVQNYGQDTVGQLLRILQPNSNIDVLSQITGSSLDQSNLDWRDFFTWRLTREQRLISEGATDAVVALYDTRDDSVTQLAYTRINQGSTSERLEAVVVRETAPAADGAAQVVVTVRIGQAEIATEQEVIFRLRDNVWRRAS